MNTPRTSHLADSDGILTVHNEERIGLADLVVIPYASFAEALLTEVAGAGRIAAYFAVPATGNELDLFAVVARDHKGDLRLLRSRVGQSFASLTPRCPQLHLFEREIAEQFGAVPEGHPWFKPLRFHGSYGTTDAWGRPGGRHPVAGEMDFYRVEGSEVHEVAVGPVHAGVIEPGHFRFQCHGEKVMHLEISLGYQHRGLEPQLVGGPHPHTIHRLETLAGDTSIGHASAYCQILESLGGHPDFSALRGFARHRPGTGTSGQPRWGYRRPVGGCRLPADGFLLRSAARRLSQSQRRVVRQPFRPRSGAPRRGGPSSWSSPWWRTIRQRFACYRTRYARRHRIVLRHPFGAGPTGGHGTGYRRDRAKPGAGRSGRAGLRAVHRRAPASPDRGLSGFL